MTPHRIDHDHHDDQDLREAPVETSKESSEPWLTLSPLTVWATLSALALLVLAPAVITAVIIGVVGTFWPWAMIPLGVGLLIYVGVAVPDYFRYRATSYRLTPEHFELRAGVLARRHRALRRDRVRNVDIATSILVRPFGLCQVIIGSGESSADELKLDTVTRAEGERLRVDLLRRGTPTAADGAAEESGDGDPGATELATLRPAWLRYGVFSPLSAVAGYSAMVAGIGILADFVASDLVVAALNAPLRMIVIAGLVGLVGALLSGAILALVLHIEAWWNYRLTRESDGTLLVRRGLLNLSSISIEEKRMRGIQFRDYLPLRWLGASSVAAVVSGFKDSGANTGMVPKRTLTPDVPRAEALRIARLAQPGATPEPLTGHPRAALRRRLFRAAAAVAGIALAAILAAWLIPGFPNWIAVVLIAMSVLAFPYAVGSYRGLGHGLSRRYLYLRGGMAARATAVLRRDAVIGWSFRQTPFQRRSDLISMGAMVAAGSGVYRALDSDTSQALVLADAAVPGLLAQFLERTDPPDASPAQSSTTR